MTIYISFLVLLALYGQFNPVLGQGITVDPSLVLHPATSYIISVNRNHVPQGEVNLAEKIQTYGAISPVFGQKKKLYRIGHGITDGRTDYSYMTGWHFEELWGMQGPYPYDDIRNALNEAKGLNADITMVVNFGTGNVSEAGQLVSYLNNPNDATRNSQGLPPFNVTIFELGNEISYTLERGHSEFAPNETVYATRCLEFIAAMRANSPIPIEIGLVTSTSSNFYGDGWSGQSASIENIIDIAGNDLDFLIFHNYPSWPLTNTANALTFVGQNQWTSELILSNIYPAIQNACSRNQITKTIKLQNTEYFTNLYGGPWQRGTLEALYTADTMIMTLLLDIRGATNFCFSHDDIADSLFFINNNPNDTTPIFAVHQLVAESLGDNVVNATGVDIPTTSISYNGNDVLNMENLAFVATTTAQGQIVLLIINRVENDITIFLDAGEFTNATQITLAGGTYENTVMPRTENVITDLKSVVIPAASVNIFTIPSSGTPPTTSTASATSAVSSSISSSSSSTTSSSSSSSTTSSSSTSSSSTSSSTTGTTGGPVNPLYKGCYEDPDNNRTVGSDPITIADMIPADCVSHCISNNFPICAIYSGTECFCGDTMPSIYTPNDCWRTCPGDPNSICGAGAWRVSIYVNGPTFSNHVMGGGHGQIKVL